ncbi:hypothetical protein ACFV4X_04585 [Streptomyces ardesiacus]|uniref:hypothetical protein n=1 Tax=Streptomyces ardesiacus TaxID=285564 RepID=UPI0036665E8D
MTTGADPRRVRFHPLEFRREGDEWIVGVQAVRRVICLPEAGADALRLLQSGRTVEETRHELFRATGKRLDISDFVTRMIDIGFVSEISDVEIPTASRLPASLPWVKPHHVQFVLNPALQFLALLTPFFGFLAIFLSGGDVPSAPDLLWSPYGTLNIALQVLVSSVLISLHELSHLATSRAFDVPGRVYLGTRLQFLVVQTEVTGIWLRGRRERLTVYLAGMASDGMIYGLCLIGIGVGFEPSVPVFRIAAVLLMLSIFNQLLVFMRTDLYFVIQDLSRCRNLYFDSTKYLTHLARKHVLRHKNLVDPSRSLGTTERRSVRIYAIVCAIGSVLCISAGAHVLLSVSVPLFFRAAEGAVGGNPLVMMDSMATIAVLACMQSLWGFLWWRRHGPALRRMSRFLRTCGH